jgi:hypothetical protein
MVSGIRSELSGREALSVIDRAAQEARRALAVATKAVDDLETERARLAEARVKDIRELARLRIDMLKAGEAGPDLDAAEKRARELLEAQERHVADAAARIAAIDDEIEALEGDREAAGAAREAAIDAHADKIAEVEASLASDASYQALVTRVEEASAIAARAEQKLELAEADRTEKGAPFEADPLFSYLWKRGYRTPSYKAGSLFRFLDGWVARLCKYDRHHANYRRLTELPVRLAEHLERVEAVEAEALERLEAAEQEALEAAGIEGFVRAIEVATARIGAIDAALEAAEARHLEAARAHEAARAERTGPIIEARELLEVELNRASFPDLRVLASETVDLDDDRVVDRLVKLRSEELALEVSGEDILELPRARRFELERLEGFRARYKSERLDSSALIVSGAVLSNVLDKLISGTSRSDDAIRTLKRSVRRRKPLRRGGFGRARGGSMRGFGDVLGEVLIEVAKQAGRSKGIDFGGGPWGGRSPGRRTSLPRPRRMPRGGSRKGGGFRTGGGF